MKEPKVHVGILSDKQIKFVLPTYYEAQGSYCQGVVTRCKVVSGEQEVTYDDGEIQWDGLSYESLVFIPFDYDNDAFELKDVTIGVNFHWERKENQRFQGALKFIIEDEKLTAVNLINVEDYLTSVISSEMSATASLELLKAHAVISRSWLISSLSSLSPNPSSVGRGVDTPCYKTADRGHYEILKGNQKRLKGEPTEAEKILWERLRNGQLGTKFRRQHIIDNYIADFASLEKKLIIEIDGEYHNTPTQQEKDKERTAHLETLGYHLLRFTNNEVIAHPDTVIEKIKADITHSPLPTGEGSGERLEFIRWYDREDHTHFDVCADDHCQRYQGITRASTDIVKQAIAATRGQVLMSGEKICDARFSKCCGGALEEFQYCWENIKYPYLAYKRDWIPSTNTPSTAPFPSPLPTGEGSGERLEDFDRWIRTSPEAFCHTTDKKILSQVLNNYDQETTDFYRWKVEYTQDELARLIRERSGIDFGQIIDLIPVARGTSGRIWKLKIVGTKQTLIIGKELEIRRTLSPSHLYSSAFVVDKKEIAAGDVPGRFILTGAGWGHGVGLCQIGAAVMGEQGYKYDQILLHYYTGATIEKLYE